VEVLQQFLSVVAVFALLGGALWLMRRGGIAKIAQIRGMRHEKKSLESIERLPLSPHHALHRIRIGSREMVVATHPQGCALLLEIGEGARQ